MFKNIKLLVIITICIALSPSWASTIDAPHNETNGVSCSSCHSYSLWWSYSPFASHSPDYNSDIEIICLSCHDGSKAPAMGKTHSSLAMDFFHRQTIPEWSKTCTNCHDPHFQTQRNWEASVPDDLYLVTGNISNGTITLMADGSTEFNYINAIADIPWQDPAIWGAKSSADRGLIMTVSDASGHNSYEIISAEETAAGQGTIKVQGHIDSVYDGVSFYLIYGQLIKSQIQTEMGSKNVKLFDPTGSVGGFVDQTASPVKEGICQVCHLATNHFRHDGSGPDPDHSNIWQPVARKCTTCHMHDHGFGHAADGGAECAPCHNSGKHVSMLNLAINCTVCHNSTMRDAGGNITIDAATSTICDDCHVDGASGQPNQSDFRAGWTNSNYNLDCNGCHSSPPLYSSGSPKANSHNSHPVDCMLCHFTTMNSSSLTISGNSNHTNQTIDVAPSPLTSFNYNYDANGGTCNNTSCHGGNSATWGTSVSLTCIDCHLDTADLDDHSLSNGINSRISQSQWLNSGHGRASGSYPVSYNAGADLTCDYCHSKNHFDDADPYQLINVSGPEGKNGVCLICHATAATGFDPDGAGSFFALKKANSPNRIDSYHYGAGHAANLNGGLFCWDCHDPHGDSNIYMIHDQVSKQTDNIHGIPLETKTTVFTNNLTGSDYAKSVDPFYGICNACHTTTYHYGTDYGDQHKSNQKCINCHLHNGTSAASGFEPQATVYQIGGRLLRVDGYGQAMTPIYIKEKSGLPYKEVYTDIDGYWSTLVADDCYDIEPAQGYRHASYFYPTALEICSEDLTIQFEPDTAPAAPLLINELDHENPSPGSPTANILLEWQPVTDLPASSPVRYYYEISRLSVIQASGYTTSTSIQFIGNASTSYSWRVLAEEIDFPGRAGTFSAEDSFFIRWQNASPCPDPAACTARDDF